MDALNVVQFTLPLAWVHSRVKTVALLSATENLVAHQVDVLYVEVPRGMSGGELLLWRPGGAAQAGRLEKCNSSMACCGRTRPRPARPRRPAAAAGRGCTRPAAGWRWS